MNRKVIKEDEMWEAVKNNNVNYDGVFFYAVKSTGIYCRPSCKSRLPKRENVCFFSTSLEAREADFRPCKRCRSELLEYMPIKDIAEEVKSKIEETYLSKYLLDMHIKNIGLSSHRLNEVFKEEYGITVSEYVSNLKLKEAERRLRFTEDKIIDIAYSLEFSSLSGFYRFFNEFTGLSPAKYRKENKGV